MDRHNIGHPISSAHYVSNIDFRQKCIFEQFWLLQDTILKWIHIVKIINIVFISA